MTCLKQPDSLRTAQPAVPTSSAGDGVANAKPPSSSSSRAAILTNPYPLTDIADAFLAKYAEYIGYTIEADQPAERTRLGPHSTDVHKTIKCLGFKKLDEDMADCLFADDEKLSLVMMTSREDYPALSGSSYLTVKLSAAPLHDTLACDWQLSQHLRQVEEQLAQANMSFLTGSGRVFSQDCFLPFTLGLGDSGQLTESLASRPGAYLMKFARDSTPRRRQLIHIDSGRPVKPVCDYILSFVSSQSAMLQAYIERPLLVDKRKFNIRAFLMIVYPKRGGDDGSGGGGRPRESGYFAFLHPGYALLRPEPFDPEDPEPSPENTDDPVSQRLMEASTWYPDELNAYLNRKRGSQLQPDWVKAVLYPRAGAMLGYLAALLRYHLHYRDSATSSFLILDVSLLVDESLRLHLLKVDDRAPRWSRPTSVIDSVLSSLWREGVCLASEITVRFRTNRTVCDDHLVARRNFRMVYSSEDPCLARKNVTLVYD